MGKIISLEARTKDICYEEISEMIDEISEYDIEVKVRPLEIKIVLQELYNLYEEKHVIYQYQEDMSAYFNEIMLMAIENDQKITNNFIFESLSFCHYLQTPVEIEKEDIDNALENAKTKIKRIGEI